MHPSSAAVLHTSPFLCSFENPSPQYTWCLLFSSCALSQSLARRAHHATCTIKTAKTNRHFILYSSNDTRNVVECVIHVWLTRELSRLFITARHCRHVIVYCRSAWWWWRWWWCYCCDWPVQRDYHCRLRTSSSSPAAAAAAAFARLNDVSETKCNGSSSKKLAKRAVHERRPIGKALQRRVDTILAV